MGAIADSFKESKKVLLLAVGLLLVSSAGLILTKNGMLMNETTDITKTTYTKPENVLEEGIDYSAIIKTNLGNIEIDLFESETPIAVNSFLFLVKNKFYDDLIFHRVVANFVIQGGDPTGTGRGGPGYSFEDEITGREYKAYSVGMANSGKNTNGSQFFITSGNISEENLQSLNTGGYTLFGEVKDGFAVVDSIERVEVNSDSKPINDVTIESIQIIEN